MTEPTENQTETQSADAPDATGAAQERTFTQAEVDDIVKRRLARVKDADVDVDVDALKAKADKADALQKQLDELTASTARDKTVREVAAETGVPAGLLATAAASASDKGGIESVAKQLVDWAASTPARHVAPAAADPDVKPKADWIRGLFGN